MISKDKILSLASKFAPSGVVDVITKAYDTTQSIMETAQSPEEALKKAGIGNKELEKIKSYTQHPLASLVLSPFGVQPSDIKQVINKLEENSFSSQETSIDELDQLRKNLELLKRGK